MSRSIALPRSSFRLRVMLRLLAFSTKKYQLSTPGASAEAMRPCSPPSGFSTLMTSAPSHASASVHEVPASNWVRSRTLIPASAPAPSRPFALIAVSAMAVSLFRRFGAGALELFGVSSENAPEASRRRHQSDGPRPRRSDARCPILSSATKPVMSPKFVLHSAGRSRSSARRSAFVGRPDPGARATLAGAGLGCCSGGARSS